MITVGVIDSNAARVVLEGAVVGNVALTQRWTITNEAIANDAGLLAQVRDELYTRIQLSLDHWNAAQAAIKNL